MIFLLAAVAVIPSSGAPTMESDVAYVRHVDEDSSYPDSSVFDQRYSAHQADPDGYETYSLETSVVAAAQHRNDGDMNYQRKTYTVDPLMTAIHSMHSPMSFEFPFRNSSPLQGF